MPDHPAGAPAQVRQLHGWRRLTSSHQELVADELAREALGSGAMPINGLVGRQPAVVQGTIAALTLNPRSGSAWLEADLHDGTGTITLIWMGHRMIPGIRPGAKLRARGTVADHEGRSAIFNPAYGLLG